MTGEAGDAVMSRSPDDGRFSVFDFEEDLLLDTFDIFENGEESGPLQLFASEPLQQILAGPQEEAANTEVVQVALVPPSNDPFQLNYGESQHAFDVKGAGEPAGTLAPPLSSDSSQLVSKKLQHCVQVMTSKVEQLQREVLQVTRARSVLKRAKSYRSAPLKERDTGSLTNKKPRLLDAARTEAVKRKKLLDLMRLCGNILRQLMQHKWAWPFMQPVDVEGLKLDDYYKVIRRPMDLGTIRIRLESKDGTGYRHVRELCEDVRLVFRNAMLYNESWTELHIRAKFLLQKFEDKWKAVIEPRLLEEEEKTLEDQQDGHLADISQLHASEEQAAETLSEEVLLELTKVESKIEGFLMQVLSKCRAMGVEEKKDLYTKLAQLPAASWNRVVDIVSISDVVSEKILIDLAVLDSSTLWRLHFFVKMVTDALNEHPSMEKKSDTSHTGGLHQMGS